MEFFLTKEVELGYHYQNGDIANVIKPDCRHTSRSWYIPLELEPCATMAEETGKIYKDRLCSVLGMNPGEFEKPEGTGGTSFYLLASSEPAVGVTEEEFAQGKGGRMEISCISNVFDEVEPPFLNKVFKKLTNEMEEESGKVSACNAAIRVEVRFPDLQNDWNIKSKDFKIQAMDEEIDDWNGAVIELGVVPDTVTKAWITKDEKSRAIITVILVLNDEVANSLLIHNLLPSMPAFTLKEMLENENEADLEIVPGETGAALVKCHRAVLAARSPVFKAMFRSGMKEAATNLIQIKEMSEPEVKAFIKYLYTWNLKDPLSDCRIALEMLKAGNCYQVADLCTTIFELMLMKTDEWFSVDVAVDLLVFSVLCSSASTSRNSGSTDRTQGEFNECRWMDLKLKAVQVLKWYSTHKPLDLVNSEGYKDLHVRNLEIAMELNASFLRVLDMEAYRQSSFAS